MREELNYLDGFSGYGGFHLGLEQAGFKFKNVYFSEIDKYAIANYRYNYPNSIYAGSITHIPTNEIIERLDLFTFGWPCQDNSIAGKRKGQQRGNRSGLFYSAVEVISKYKPRLFIAENVPGLKSVNKGIDIIEGLKILSDLSTDLPQYDIEMQLLNTRWLLPQNRERLYFVGHFRGSGTTKIFPLGKGSIRDETPGTEEGSRLPISRCLIKKVRLDSDTENFIEVNQGDKILLAKEGDYVNRTRPSSTTKRGIIDQISHTLDKNALHCTVDGKRLRRMTPKERERLQGLPDDWTRYGIFNDKAKEISDAQRINLTGNGVSIPIIKMIAEKLIQNYE